MPHRNYRQQRDDTQQVDDRIDGGQDAVEDVKNAVEPVVEEAAGKTQATADHVKDRVNIIAETGRQAVGEAYDAASKTVQNAHTKVNEAYQQVQHGAEAYVERGKQAVDDARERAASLSQTAKDNAHKVVESTKQTAQLYAEKAKQARQNPQETFDEAKEAIRERTNRCVENGREKVAGLKGRIKETAEPVVSEVQRFDVTSTSVFRYTAHLISSLIYFVYTLVSRFISLDTWVAKTKSKVESTGVTPQLQQAQANTVEFIQKVPVVGARSVKIATVFSHNVKRDFDEQRNHAKAMAEEAR